MAATDAITLLTKDHREAETLFGKIEACTGNDDKTLSRKRDLAEEVVTELIRHSIAEEEYLYPAVRDALPDGDQIADREISEHSEAEKTMKKLEGLSPDNIEFDAAFRTLVTQIKAHVSEEEGELFPRLQQVCTPEQLRELGGKLETAKKIAPTRPHPSSPKTPPGNKMVGPLVGLVDRLRDALTGRGAKR